MLYCNVFIVQTYCEEIFIQREVIIELNDVIDWLGTKLGHPWLHQPDRFLRERVLGSHSGQDGEGRHIQPEWAGYQGLGRGQGGLSLVTVRSRRTKHQRVVHTAEPSDTVYMGSDYYTRFYRLTESEFFQQFFSLL